MKKNNFEATLAELFIELPTPYSQLDLAHSVVMQDNRLYISNALPYNHGRLQHAGKIGIDVSLDQATQAARMAVVMFLAMAKHQLTSINNIKRIRQIEVEIACAANFYDHFRVADIVSDLINNIFGRSGAHFRKVHGVVSLPYNACISLSGEIDVHSKMRKILDIGSQQSQ